MASSILWRVTAMLKSGSAAVPFLRLSACLRRSWATFKGGPSGTEAGTQRCLSGVGRASSARSAPRAPLRVSWPIWAE